MATHFVVQLDTTAPVVELDGSPGLIAGREYELFYTVNETSEFEVYFYDVNNTEYEVDVDPDAFRFTLPAEAPEGTGHFEIFATDEVWNQSEYEFEVQVAPSDVFVVELDTTPPEITFLTHTGGPANATLSVGYEIDEEGIYDAYVLDASNNQYQATWDDDFIYTDLPAEATSGPARLVVITRDDVWNSATFEYDFELTDGVIQAPSQSHPGRPFTAGPLIRKHVISVDAEVEVARRKLITIDAILELRRRRAIVNSANVELARRLNLSVSTEREPAYHYMALVNEDEELLLSGII